MSYILDALRKADAQRESDPARGIHAQPVRAAIGEHRPEDGYRTAFWGASGAALVALAAVGWYLYRDSAPPQAPVAAMLAAAPLADVKPVPETAPSNAAVAPDAAASAQTPPEPAAAVLPPPVVVPAPVTAPAHAVAKAAPAPARPPVAKASAEMLAGPAAVSQPSARPTAAHVPTARSAAAAASATALPAPSAAAAAASPDSAPPISGLPSDAPKLAISGGVYSANAGQRMLIVNGQVFNEGSEIGPAVVLEEIKPKAAVVRFRGSRYTVGF